MTLFKNYEEYLETITIICKDLSDESLQKIGLAMNVCDSYMDDSEKIYRLNTTVMKCLWEIEEAIHMGFTQYLRKEYVKTRYIIDYYKENNENPCPFLELMKEIKIKMRNSNERKEPPVCS
jgi:hypothetical protein